MPDAVAAAIRRLLARGEERGHVTVGEVDAALPRWQVSSELVEDVLALLGDLGVHVVERGDPDDGEAAAAGPRGPSGRPPPPRPGAEAPLDDSEARRGDANGGAR